MIQAQAPPPPLPFGNDELFCGELHATQVARAITIHAEAC